MPVTTPLPAVPSTSSPDSFSEDTDAFLSALPQFQTELDAFASSVVAFGRNVLTNSSFSVAQRFTSATAVADDNYALDRWYILTQTASVNASQLTDPEDGYTHAMRLSQSQASA